MKTFTPKDLKNFYPGIYNNVEFYQTRSGHWSCLFEGKEKIIEGTSKDGSIIPVLIDRQLTVTGPAGAISHSLFGSLKNLVLFLKKG